ncbi:hypothetical protein M404DRAFT_996202 [Pisolithus tinctorius Marx 270]|uniref:Uncharacterized protein n=1 Tax=Pisolithus tinctorius Marx 270 TaxID=870435 RepID=A0A0C3KII9_PISTI|nr:hypothetical protein M404DRAFT_996202 [Pisolithus tinctorius Marx 270]
MSEDHPRAMKPSLSDVKLLRVPIIISTYLSILVQHAFVELPDAPARERSDKT